MTLMQLIGKSHEWLQRQFNSEKRNEIMELYLEENDNFIKVRSTDGIVYYVDLETRELFNFKEMYNQVIAWDYDFLNEFIFPKVAD